jgi:hypothetical protein
MASIFGCGVPQNCCDVITTQINGIAPASQITVMDTLSLTEYDSVQWNITIVDPTQNKRRMQVIHSTHEGGITPYHNISSIIGSKKQDFDYLLDVDITLGSFRLTITNNSLVDYIYEIIRIPIEIFTPTV